VFWKAKISLKIKFFLWYLKIGVTLTKDNLFIAFNIQPPKYNMHLFGMWLRSFSPSLRNQIIVGLVVMCWALWLNRNDAVFNTKKVLTHSCGNF
jgi:hypothetical protein